MPSPQYDTIEPPGLPFPPPPSAADALGLQPAPQRLVPGLPSPNAPKSSTPDFGTRDPLLQADPWRGLPTQTDPGTLIEEKPDRLAPLKNIDPSAAAEPADAQAANYVSRVMQLEGSGKDPRSSAVGGFIDKTWLSLVRRNVPEASGLPDDQVLSLRSNPELRARMVAAYARDNSQVLQQAGLPINATTLRLAHWFGPQGAVKVLSAPQDTPMRAMFGDEVILANPILQNKTAGDVVSLTQSQMNAPSLKQQWNGALSPDVRAMLDNMQSAGERDHAENMAIVQRHADEAAKAPAGSKERLSAIDAMRGEVHKMTEKWSDLSSHPPVEKPIDMWQNFGSAATIVAMLGGLFAHRHLTAALNAGGAAMEAINSNNHEKFLQEYKTWDHQTTLGLKMVDLQNQEIRALLDDEKMAQDEKRARLDNLFKEYGMIHQDQANRRSDDMRIVEMVNGNERAAAQAKNWKAMIDAEVLSKRAAEYKAQDPSLSDTDAMLKAMADLSSATSRSRVAAKPENIEAKDASGKTIYSGAATFDPTTKQYTPVGKDKPLPADTQIVRQTASAGNRVQPQLQRLLGAGSQLEAHLSNLAEMPIDVTIGPFMGVEGRQPEELGEALKRAFVRKTVVGESAKEMQLEFIGVSRQIATLDAQGVGQGLVGLSKQAEGYAPLPGDTTYIVMRKYASLRQIVEQAMRAIEISGTANADQKAGAADIVKSVQKSIPWTVHDLNELEYGDPTKGARHVAEKILGKGGSEGTPKYTVGQIIEHGGKRYRVIGGDLTKDPDIEEIKEK